MTPPKDEDPQPAHPNLDSEGEQKFLVVFFTHKKFHVHSCALKLEILSPTAVRVAEGNKTSHFKGKTSRWKFIQLWLIRSQVHLNTGVRALRTH